jgi:hypothetical protein
MPLATTPGGLRGMPVRCQPHEEAGREPGKEVGRAEAGGRRRRPVVA